MALSYLRSTLACGVKVSNRSGRGILFACTGRLHIHVRLTDVHVRSMQAVTARPGARFGPGGIRQGSRRMMPQFAWDVYSGMQRALYSGEGSHVAFKVMQLGMLIGLV